MHLCLLTLGLARAEDPTGARPGAGAPVLVWSPVLELRSGVETWPEDDLVSFPLAVRLGIDGERKALAARVSVQGAAVVELGGAREAGLTVGEAWVRWSPPISSALGVDVTLGRQRLEFEDGAVVGDDDLRRAASFPLAARATFRALPWQLDVVSGFSNGAADRNPGAAGTAAGDGAPFHTARLAAGRANADTSWSVAGIGLVMTDDGLPAERDPFGTVGLRFDVSQKRFRVGGDAWLQPTTAGPATMGGGRLGWTFGDDGRAVLWAALDHLGGGDSPVFLRPMADTASRFGWLGAHDAGQPHAGEGALDAAFVVEATLAPPLRVHGALHHLWDGSGSPRAGELDVELRWYLSPLASLHLRGAVEVPWVEGDGIRLRSAVVIDATL
ncbi:MAG: hypothetical protein EXR71_07205 [Myxococcales bacterium]|nr:hypothetical protein [Myxococcales bacterium]